MGAVTTAASVTGGPRPRTGHTSSGRAAAARVPATIWAQYCDWLLDAGRGCGSSEPAGAARPLRARCDYAGWPTGSKTGSGTGRGTPCRSLWCAGLAVCRTDVAPLGVAKLGPNGRPQTVRPWGDRLWPCDLGSPRRVAGGCGGDRLGTHCGKRGGRPALSGVSALPSIWSSAASMATPALRVLLRHRARRGKEIAARLHEREGREPIPRPRGRLLWLHAASVGESVSILPVLTEIAGQAPNLTMLLTTGTVTSATLLKQRLPELALGERVMHRFIPFDVPRWGGRFLDHWRPDVAVLVESELWPNLLAGCRSRGIPVGTTERTHVGCQPAEMALRAWTGAGAAWLASGDPGAKRDRRGAPPRAGSPGCYGAWEPQICGVAAACGHK